MKRFYFKGRYTLDTYITICYNTKKTKNTAQLLYLDAKYTNTIKNMLNEKSCLTYE